MTDLEIKLSLRPKLEGCLNKYRWFNFNGIQYRVFFLTEDKTHYEYRIENGMKVNVQLQLGTDKRPYARIELYKGELDVTRFNQYLEKLQNSGDFSMPTIVKKGFDIHYTQSGSIDMMVLYFEAR